jgi:ribosomal protein S12 methylthiotransferase accessory factor YcaO
MHVCLGAARADLPGVRLVIPQRQQAAAGVADLMLAMLVDRPLG